jgi:hypothetical protein
MNIINFDNICDAIDEACDGSYIGELAEQSEHRPHTTRRTPPGDPAS